MATTPAPAAAPVHPSTLSAAAAALVQATKAQDPSPEEMDWDSVTWTGNVWVDVPNAEMWYQYSIPQGGTFGAVLCWWSDGYMFSDDHPSNQPI